MIDGIMLKHEETISVIRLNTCILVIVFVRNKLLNLAI